MLCSPEPWAGKGQNAGWDEKVGEERKDHMVEPLYGLPGLPPLLDPDGAPDERKQNENGAADEKMSRPQGEHKPKAAEEINEAAPVSEDDRKCEGDAHRVDGAE